MACNHPHIEHGRCWSDGCSYCTHETKFNGVCVACSYVDENELSRAKRQEKSELKRLQSEKKLPLIIDFDNTLMHATSVYDVAEWINRQKRNKENRSRVKDLFTASNDNFSFKLRPGLYRFLTLISTMYELHVYTMGNTKYAESFLERIDPKRNLFKGNIFTKDGNGCTLKKKLSRLYPTSHAHVLILDDCANVWDDSPNLIQIKPYIYFKNVKPMNQLLNSKPIKNQLFSIVNTYSSSNLSRRSFSDESQSGSFKLDSGESKFLAPAMLTDDNNVFSISSTQCTDQTNANLDDNLADVIPDAPENDHVLEHIGKMLRDIHTIYFNNLSSNNEPDVVDILHSLCTEKRTATLKRKRSTNSTDNDYIQNKKCNSICRSTSSTTLTIP